MKNVITLIILALSLILNSSCKKENPSMEDSEEVRLLSLTDFPSNSPRDSTRFVLNYDGNFRFAGFQYYNAAGIELVFDNYDIYYNDNNIITNYSIVRDFPVYTVNSQRDTLILDIFSNIQQKKWGSVKSWTYDSTSYKDYYSNVKNYAYQPSGLFSGIKEYGFDSLWEKKGSEIYITNSFDTTVYTSSVSSENLMRMNIEKRYRNIIKNLSTNSIITTQSSRTITREYFYTSNNPYPPLNTYNYLMNDYFPFDIYLNAGKNFQQLPDKIKETTVYKDGSGNITNSLVEENSYKYTYNSLGYIKTILRTRITSPSSDEFYFFRYNRE
jgi:hypothetical protein